MDQIRLAEKGTFEPRLEGHEGVSYMDIWEQIVSERENSKCKGPGTQVSLRCVGNGKDTTVSQAESDEGCEDVR